MSGSAFDESRFRTLFDQLVAQGMDRTQAATSALVQVKAEQEARGGAGAADGSQMAIDAETAPVIGSKASTEDANKPAPMDEAPSQAIAPDSGKEVVRQTGEVGTEAVVVGMEVAVEGLSIETLRELLGQARATGDQGPAAAYLSQAFKQSAVLNASFLLPYEVGAEEGEEGLRINIDAVGEFYKMLRDADEQMKVRHASVRPRCPS
jgi:hypothetical protein